MKRKIKSKDHKIEKIQKSLAEYKEQNSKLRKIAQKLRDAVENENHIRP